MQINFRTLSAAAWIGTVAVVALAANIATPTGWVLAAGVAATLPAIMFLLWREPKPSMSERIKEALR